MLEGKALTSHVKVLCSKTRFHPVQILPLANLIPHLQENQNFINMGIECSLHCGSLTAVIITIIVTLKVTESVPSEIYSFTSLDWQRPEK
jgi:hypothetical protein